MKTETTFIQKEMTIYDLMNEGKDSKTIAEETGFTRNTVTHTMEKLRRYSEFAPMDEYFAMANDLYPMVDKCDGNANHQLPAVMSALWFSGCTKRTKLKMMSNADFIEFCETKKMRRAGRACIEALTEYKALLKKTKLGK